MPDLLAAVRGCTFDDFLFAPRFSVLERRDPKSIDLSARFSEHIVLKHPIVSANMDTITRAAMAVVQAEEGGLGVIDRGFRGGDIAAQVREVEIVKRTQHGVIPDPYTVEPTDSLAHAGLMMKKSGVGTLVVVDGARKLKGLLTARDVRFVSGQRRVSDRMTPLDNLVVHSGPISLEQAEQVMVERKIKKLPLVDDSGALTGLITAKDIIEQKRLPLATRDPQGRLRVGAAIGAKGDYLERAAELIKAGVDVLVIDIAHGHSIVMAKALEAFRTRFGDFELVAGNVATADGATYLAERGVNGIKVGIGPGGGCTTRLNTNFGVPQLHALVECRLAVGSTDPFDRRRRDQARRRDHRSAAVRRRYRDARQRIRGHHGDARRDGAQIGRAARVTESRARPVQGVSRHGVDRGDGRSPGCGRRGLGRRRHAWSRRPRSERAAARFGAADHRRDVEAPLVLDIVWRRGEPGRAEKDVLGAAGRLHD